MTLEVAPVPEAVKARTVAVSGKVSPARAILEVTADDGEASVAEVAADGTFSIDVNLPELGQSVVRASARVGTQRAVAVRVLVERMLSPAEVAAKRERIQKRRAAAVRERERREAARVARAERRTAKRQAAAEDRAAQEAAEAEPEPAPTNDCDPNYSGCVPAASDVDCSGGSGDGPAYTGPVTVIGTDLYDLDSDSDGTACE